MCASRIRLGARGLGVLASVWLSGCGYNALQAQDARVETAWSEVVSQYQQRAALAPNLVNIVRGYAPQEQTLLDGVSDAEAKARAFPVSSKLIDDPKLLGQFQTAQNELSTALSHLVAISEKYPDLKSDQNFRDAQALLETSEERIAAARGHYVDAVHDYNHTVHAFPEKLTASLLGFHAKADLATPNQAAVARPPPAAVPASSGAPGEPPPARSLPGAPDAGSAAAPDTAPGVPDRSPPADQTPSTEAPAPGPPAAEPPPSTATPEPAAPDSNVPQAEPTNPGPASAPAAPPQRR
jgi:LemA protein